MNKTSKVKGALEVLLVIGLILFIPLFFAIKTAADRQEAKNTPVPSAPTASEVPEINSVAVAKQPPQCTFPLAQTTTAESTPEEYTFSEPPLVITSPNSIGIVEWLPDNRRVLITRDVLDNNNRYQSIELFNPQTGETQVYATRTTTVNAPPSWLSELNAVVYPVMNILKNDKINHRYEFTRQIWVSRGNPKNVQLVADNLPNFYVVVKPGLSQIAYLSDKQLAKRNASLESLQSVAFDSTQWEYRRSIYPSVPYELAWQPGSSQVFLYSNGDAGGYTFLLDVDTGKVCEVNLSSEVDGSDWATVAHWSPDGRYLAVVRTWGAQPVNSSDLAVLDIATGKLYTMTLFPLDVQGLHFVNDIAWAPDNRHLAAIGQIHYHNQELGNLYLVDFLSEQSVLISSTQNLGSGLGDTNLLWSNDGSQLLIKCPTHQEDRLCLLSVQKNIQP